VAVIAFIYVAAAEIVTTDPRTGARYAKQSAHRAPVGAGLRPLRHHAVARQDSADLAGGDDLFWGAGATLQFIILKWLRDRARMTLSQARSCRRWSPSASPSAR